MTRTKMIAILIEDRLWEWVYASCYDGLKEMLANGFKGFDNYTDAELKDAIAEFDDGTLKELESMVRKRV